LNEVPILNTTGAVADQPRLLSNSRDDN